MTRMTRRLAAGTTILTIALLGMADCAQGTTPHGSALPASAAKVVAPAKAHPNHAPTPQQHHAAPHKSGQPTTKSPMAEAKPVWNTVTAGFALAKKLNKPILVDVFTDWCGWCKVLEKETLHNPEISKYIADKFVLVRCDAEDHADGEALATKYNIHVFPLVVIFEPNGQPKGGVVGFKPPAEFREKLDELMSGKEAKEPAKDPKEPANDPKQPTSDPTLPTKDLKQPTSDPKQPANDPK